MTIRWAWPVSLALGRIKTVSPILISLALALWSFLVMVVLLVIVYVMVAPVRSFFTVMLESLTAVTDTKPRKPPNRRPPPHPRP
jgi:hypothetical protein